MGSPVVVRKLDIPGYVLYAPRYAAPLHSLTRSQAEESYSFFLEQIPIRLGILCGAVSGSYDCQILDYSESSLELLADWFGAHVCGRMKTDEELLEDQKGTPSRFSHHIQNWTLDEITFSLCYDVGIYLASYLQENVGGSWALVQKPRNSIDFQRPILVSPKGGAKFSPLQVVPNIAYGLVDGSNPPEELMRVSGVWKNNFLHF
jgi:hypothetical protein